MTCYFSSNRVTKAPMNRMFRTYSAKRTSFTTPPQKFNKLRAYYFIAIGLFLVLHEVLPGRKRRIDVDKLNPVTSSKAVRSLLVNKQFSQRQKIVAPHKQISPAVWVRSLSAELADKLPWRGRSLRKHFFPSHLPVIDKPILFAKFLLPQAIREQPPTPLLWQRLASVDHPQQLFFLILVK